MTSERPPREKKGEEAPEYLWVYMCDDWIDGWVPVKRSTRLE